MSRQNLKFKISVVGGLVIFPCPGWIQNFKFSVRMGGQSFSISRPNLKFRCFSEGWGIGHLTMSRPNLKFKIFGEGGGSVIFPCPGQIWNLKLFEGGVSHLPCPGQIWNLKISLRVGELVILPCPDQIWNLKFSVRVGGQSSFHVQAKFEI